MPVPCWFTHLLRLGSLSLPLLLFPPCPGDYPWFPPVCGQTQTDTLKWYLLRTHSVDMLTLCCHFFPLHAVTHPECWVIAYILTYLLSHFQKHILYIPMHSDFFLHFELAILLPLKFLGSGVNPSQLMFYVNYYFFKIQLVWYTCYISPYTLEKLFVNWNSGIWHWHLRGFLQSQTLYRMTTDA